MPPKVPPAFVENICRAILLDSTGLVLDIGRDGTYCEVKSMDNHQLQPLRRLLEQKDWHKAWQEFLRLNAQGSPSASLLLMGSHAAYGRKEFFRARDLGGQALKALSPLDPPGLLGRIRFHLGMTHRQLGDTRTAGEQFRRFLAELHTEYPELAAGEGKAHFYLALILRDQGNPGAALDAYRDATACFKRDGLPSLLCRTLQNTAWLLCQMRRPVEARDCLAHAAQLINIPLERIHQQLGEAFLAAVEGDWEYAMEQCDAILDQPEDDPTIRPQERAQAAWIAGTAHLAQGQLEEADTLASLAVRYAAQARIPRLVHDAGALQKTVYMRKEVPE